MAITNVQIIFNESLKLVQQGILKTTGRTIILEMEDGSKKELPEPEPIHTYNGWKELGYQVKKGEHAKATFPIWKYSGKKGEEAKNDEANGEYESGGKCWMRKAFWFTFDQVEKVS